LDFAAIESDLQFICQSKPATAIALAISTLRVIRTPTPSDSWPSSSFSRATLRTVAGISRSLSD
jgi:hypothetical protein